MTTLCEILADFLMLAHAGYSLFLVGGLVLMVAGMILGWRWTRGRWFRLLYLSATILLVARVWTGIPCPFSVAEDGLRRNTTGSCPLGIEFHASLHRLAFRRNDPRQFASTTTVFGTVVLATFLLSGFMPSEPVLTPPGFGVRTVLCRFHSKRLR